jgi:hypothetical protein
MNTKTFSKKTPYIVERLTAGFIARSKKKHGNKFDYAHTVFLGRNKGLITVGCPEHGLVTMSERGHFAGPGCPQCGETMRRNKLSLGGETFIARALETHKGFYDYSRVKYVSAHTKVEIVCPLHGAFLQSPDKHARGSVCPKCAHLFTRARMVQTKPEVSPTTGRFVKKNHADETFEQKARKTHGDKYRYDKVQLGSNVDVKVTITCPEHGDFEQIPRFHLKGQGCPQCRIIKVGDDKRGTKESFISNAIRVHGHTFDYARVAYINDKTPVLIGCKVHGFFSQKPNTHLNGAGCRICSEERSRIERTRTTEQYIAAAKEVHGEHTYDYSQTEYKGCEHKVKIICPKHGVFKQNAAVHLNSRGCPVCRSSQGEKRLRQIFTQHDIKFIQQFRLPDINLLYRYDFYLYELNILVEFHGIQHYESVGVFGGDERFALQQKRDAMKKSLAWDRRIPLLEFDYRQLKWSKDRFEQFVMQSVMALSDQSTKPTFLKGEIGE